MKSRTLYLTELWNRFVDEQRVLLGSDFLYKSKMLSTGSGKKSVWEIWKRSEKGERTVFIRNTKGRGGCPVFIHAEKIIDYQQWRNILETYCLAGRKAVVRGEVLKLGQHLGHLRAVLVERNHNKKRVNFHATYHQQPKVERDGKLVPERIIYHTDDFYPMISYVRKGMLKNQKNYRFVIAKGNSTGKGFPGELHMQTRLQPELLALYPKKLLKR